MFKKDPGEELTPSQSRPVQSPSAGQAPKPNAARGGGPATIGPSITIKGDVTGNEDLVIQGKIDGKVDLAKHNVTIGPEGRVKADVFGRSVIVEGEVEGDLRGEEQVILRHSAKVQGNITAPRVALEDGATFRGGIEMESSGKRSSAPVNSVGTGAAGGSESERHTQSPKVAAATEGKSESVSL